METKYLIIGNSVTGVNCVEGIRKIDRDGKIVIVSNETLYNYSKPLISYYLAGKFSEKDITFRNRDFYEENSVVLLLETTAVSIDVEKKNLITTRGNIYFEKLLIATGGSPFIPEIQGYSKDTMGVWTFTSFSDAKSIKNYIEEKNIDNAVVLGGGLIGLKCAEGLLERGIKIHIIEIADRLLSSTLDSEASSIIESFLLKKECVVYKKSTIERIYSRDNKINKIKLKSGEEIETELLVIAAGVKPEITIIKDTSIKYNRGIIVDRFMRTSINDIYAAGDVVETMNLLTGEHCLIPIWPAAARQGKIAGINMAGGQIVYLGTFPMNSIEISGLPVISSGITVPENPENFEIIKLKDSGVYKKIVLKDGKIVGFVFLGKIERSGIYTGLVKQGMNVSDFKESLLQEEFGLLMLPEEYRKHMVVGDGIEV